MIKRTNAKLILHSGWRFWFDLKLKPLRIEAQRLIELLAEEGLTISGVTPDLTTEDLHNCHVEQHQVKTNQEVGLTAEDIMQAEEILLKGRITYELKNNHDIS